jgi:PII-like signaling protein
MEHLEKATKLTVFVDGDERSVHRPLYELVIDILREHKFAGVTLTRGAMSYSGRKLIHSALNEVTMNDLPIIIEAVDVSEKTRTAAEQIATFLGERGLVQIQPTTIVLHENREGSES